MKVSWVHLSSRTALLFACHAELLLSMLFHAIEQGMQWTNTHGFSCFVCQQIGIVHLDALTA